MRFEPMISKNIRCRVPEAFAVGEGSIIDDFCYFSTRVEIGRFCHVATCVSVGGGRDHTFRLGDFSSVSAGARIWCRSDDFTCDLAALAPAGIAIPKHTIAGDVTIGECSIIGSNSVILPDNAIPAGVAIGALSLVPPGFPFEAWSVYAGVPIAFLKVRDRDEVLRQKELLERQLAQGRG